MEIQRIAVENAWRDTTHEAICDIFSSANDEQHLIYKTIQGFIGGNTHFRKLTNLGGFFRRISKIFQGKYGKPFPQDLVPEVVSRLPAEDVLNCIMVCKGWMDVILTSQFFHLHESRAPPPMILIQNYDRTNDTKLYSLDLTHEEPYIRRFDTTKLLDCHYYLLGTFDGLLLLHTPDRYSFRLSICNPLTGRVITGVTVEGDYCCGVWFHPIKREYLFLIASSYQYTAGLGYCYKIFNLKGESTVLGWYDTLPARGAPINYSHSLYFMLQYTIGYPRNCIMIFDIETEKVDFKPHPHSDHCAQGHGGGGLQNEDMRLLEIEGSLALAHVCADTKSLYLWIVVDSKNWHWIERYRINLNWRVSRQINWALHPLSVQKGEMLMFYKPNRLIAFNLETRRVRKIDLNIVYLKCYTIVIPTTYRSSFVGLNRLDRI